MDLPKTKNVQIYFLFTYDKKQEPNIEIPSFKVNSFNIMHKDIPTKLYQIIGIIEKNPIKILIDKKPYLLIIKDIKEGKTYFLFNQALLYIENLNIKIKLNYFDINEEFDIFFENIQQKDILIDFTLNMLKEGNENSTFGLFLTLFIKIDYLYHLIKEDILLKIKHVGNLSGIDSQNLEKLSEIRNLKNIFLIYNILLDNIERLKDNKNVILYYLEKYNNLFINSLKLYPKYSFLIQESDSLEKIKSILKYSADLVDFMNIINENKEHISRLIKELNKGEAFCDKKNLIIINEIFDIKNIFNEKFNEDFYKTLIDIKEYEYKTNNIFLSFSLDNKLKNDLSLLKLMPLIRGYIFFYLTIDKSYFKKLELINLFNDKNFLESKAFFLNNYEIFTLFDILFSYKINLNFISDLVKLINFNSINENEIKLYSNINWEPLFEDNEAYKNFLMNMLTFMKNINNFELIFILINKLEEYINNLKNKEKLEIENNEKGFSTKFIRIKDEFNTEIDFSITILQKNYFQFLENNLNSLQQENNLIKISSKLIYLSNKNKEKKIFY